MKRGVIGSLAFFVVGAATAYGIILAIQSNSAVERSSEERLGVQDWVTDYAYTLDSDTSPIHDGSDQGMVLLVTDPACLACRLKARRIAALADSVERAGVPVKVLIVGTPHSISQYAALMKSSKHLHVADSATLTRAGLRATPATIVLGKGGVVRHFKEGDL